MEYQDLIIEALKAEGRPVTPDEIRLLDMRVTELADVLADHILATRAESRRTLRKGRRPARFDAPPGER